MEQIIYGITAIIYAIFIIRFILSWVGGDFDLDMDADGDLDLGDLVSFKGINHFLMGIFTWLSTKLFTTHSIEWYDYLIAFFMGIVFVIILFYTYKLMMKLESKPVISTKKDLIGKEATIYLKMKFIGDDIYHYNITVGNGNGTIEVSAISKKLYNVGDKVSIKNYNNSYYII